MGHCSFPLFLLKGFCSPFAEIGEMDESYGLGFEEVFGGGGLGGESIGCGCP